MQLYKQYQELSKSFEKQNFLTMPVYALHVPINLFILHRPTWPRGYKTFFILNLVEHVIVNAHKYKKNQEIRPFLGSGKS